MAAPTRKTILAAYKLGGRKAVNELVGPSLVPVVCPACNGWGYQTITTERMVDADGNEVELQAVHTRGSHLPPKKLWMRVYHPWGRSRGRRKRETNIEWDDCHECETRGVWMPMAEYMSAHAGLLEEGIPRGRRHYPPVECKDSE